MIVALVSSVIIVIGVAASRLHDQEDIRGPLSELQLEVMTDIQEQILDYRCIDLHQVYAIYSSSPKFGLTEKIECSFTLMTIDVQFRM